MNIQILKENWNAFKRRLKQTYPELSDEDLIYVEGRVEELISQIQQKIGLMDK